MPIEKLKTRWNRLSNKNDERFQLQDEKYHDAGPSGQPRRPTPPKVDEVAGSEFM